MTNFKPHNLSMDLLYPAVPHSPRLSLWSLRVDVQVMFIGGTFRKEVGP